MCHLRGRDPFNLITEATFDFETSLPNGRRTPARASPPSRCTTPGPCADSTSFESSDEMTDRRVTRSEDSKCWFLHCLAHGEGRVVSAVDGASERDHALGHGGVKLGHFRRFARGFLTGVSLLLLVSTRHVIVTCAAVSGSRQAASQALTVAQKVTSTRFLRQTALIDLYHFAQGGFLPALRGFRDRAGFSGFVGIELARAS